MEKVKVIKERLKTAQSHQKSYSDVRRRGLEFQEDDWASPKAEKQSDCLRKSAMVKPTGVVLEFSGKWIGPITGGNSGEIFVNSERYWEWAEDVLGGSQQTLSTPKIYDAVYASLFTYDRNLNILQAFCEAWCPKTNTLLTSVRKLSISLWDLHILGGLPIAVSPYEEVVPETRELIGLDEKHIRFIPRSCEYLFDAFHHLKEENSIHPETFKMASMMASGRKISLAVPVLASIYHGLNKISCSSQLDQVKVYFHIHYVYGWLAHYFKTHYPLAKGSSVPLMVAYSREGAARYFDEKDARKCIHNGEDIVWTPTMLTNSRPYYYVDNDAPQVLKSNYFMSLRFNYLPLTYGNSFIIEPYSPHRFGRQFGFYQNVPGFLENDIRSASIDERLRFWRICTLYRSMSRAAFPPTGDPVEKPFSTNYLS
uniref:Aminotransferase-like plant mobile domain-containing protein n=1 Tax=Nicotiana tabacum TaxID=4097 RepID=A0A1S3X7S5_TOBAC|nr:PREDICTED: uncharacterized protein LOC107762125 [Nicotiana tabacum]